jgi:hypothetical protein
MMPCACARILTSSSFITTSKRRVLSPGRLRDEAPFFGTGLRPKGRFLGGRRRVNKSWIRVNMLSSSAMRSLLKNSTRFQPRRIPMQPHFLPTGRAVASVQFKTLVCNGLCLYSQRRSRPAFRVKLHRRLSAELPRSQKALQSCVTSP